VPTLRPTESVQVRVNSSRLQGLPSQNLPYEPVWFLYRCDTRWAMRSWIVVTLITLRNTRESANQLQKKFWVCHGTSQASELLASMSLLLVHCVFLFSIPYSKLRPYKAIKAPSAKPLSQRSTIATLCASSPCVDHNIYIFRRQMIVNHDLANNTAYATKSLTTKHATCQPGEEIPSSAGSSYK
jgi:hypothetical protein